MHCRQHPGKRRAGPALRSPPACALETIARPLAVGLEGPPSRGATVIDWQRQGGRPDRARILMRYDQARFEAMLRAALVAA